jgi:hypothetical protein
MPDTIPQHYVDTFNSTWYTLSQQKKCRLHAFVDMDNFQGDRKRYGTAAAMNWAAIAARKADTRITDMTLAHRWAYNLGYDIATDQDEWDETLLGNVASPSGEAVKLFAAGYNRLKDDVVWQAAIGIAKAGEDGTTDVALPSGQIIPFAASGSPNAATAAHRMTIDKLLAAKELLDDGSDTDPDDPDGGRVMICTAKQITDLLKTTEIKSADFNTVKALAAGQIDTFCGFKFIRIKRLPTVDNTGAAVAVGTANAIRRCVAFVKGAVCLNESAYKSYMDRIADKQHKIQVRATARLGAVRREDALVARLDCVE